MQGTGRCPLCRGELTAGQVFGIDDLVPHKPSTAIALDDDDDDSEEKSNAAAMEVESLFDGVKDLASSSKFDAVIKQLKDCLKYGPLSSAICDSQDIRRVCRCNFSCLYGRCAWA